MSCDNVITVQDLETDKKHSTFYREVITGKAGGTGADIDSATNAVTGQTQATLPKVLSNVGFSPAGFDFTTGGTLTERDKAIFYQADGNWYSWGGTLPKAVPPASSPASTGGIADNAWNVSTSAFMYRDWEGFTAELLAQGGVPDNGLPDELGASQRVEAIKALIEKRSSWVTPKQRGAVGGGADDTSVLAYMFQNDEFILIDDDYVFKTNLTPKSGQIVVCLPSKKLIAGNPWVDSTGGADGLQRGCVNIVGQSDLIIYNLSIETDVNGLAFSQARTPFFLRDSENVKLINCSGLHTENVTSSVAPFDIERRCRNVVIDGGVWQNETGASSGGAWVRNIAASGGSTSDIEIKNATFKKNSGDEALAVYGVLGLTENVEIHHNKFINNDNITQTCGTLISVFPLKATGAGADVGVKNIKFYNNTIYAGGFTNSAFRVGNSADVACTCDEVDAYDNTFYISNALPTSDVIRFIKCVGEKGSFRNNRVVWTDTSYALSAINGVYGDTTGNTVECYASRITSGCTNVTGNVRLINYYASGRAFYNCDKVLDNVKVVADGISTLSDFPRTSEIKRNDITVNGSANALSSNLGTNGAYHLDDNNVKFMVTVSNVIQLGSTITAKSKLKNNKFTGVAAAEYYSGAHGCFDEVDGNTWWGRNDERNSAPPYTTYGYNRMMPVGKFVYNNNIGASIGTVTLGWSKQETNSVVADWKAVKATI